MHMFTVTLGTVCILILFMYYNEKRVQNYVDQLSKQIEEEKS